MKKNLKISLIQTHIHWENRDENLKMLDEKLSIINNVDIIILPEMFNTGFTMNAEKFAEEVDGVSMSWIIRKSKELDSVIVGSLIIKEHSSYYNRLVWIQPDGIIFHYDKRHLFSMSNEHRIYSPGKEKLIIEYNGWKICPMICFDLRFPVWIRNVDEYELLIFVASWPEQRIEHWKKLLPARAIENQCYVIGVNRTGCDSNNIYNGQSMVVNPMGQERCMGSEEGIDIVTFIYDEVIKLRQDMQFLKDQDSFKIVI